MLYSFGAAEVGIEHWEVGCVVGAGTKAMLDNDRTRPDVT